MTNIIYAMILLKFQMDYLLYLLFDFFQIVSLKNCDWKVNLKEYFISNSDRKY